LKKRISLTIAALVLTAGASELLQKPSQSEVVPAFNTATDGAYRDGLFLGGRAAKTGSTSHPSIGRWSAQQDRNAFLAGYAQGYSHPDATR
jgi:hypothetical protein